MSPAVYIACHDQKRAIEVADAIGDAGFETTSRWLVQPFGPSNTFDEDTRRRFAAENFDDVRRSDVLVLVAGPDRYSGGKFVEAGFAYGLGKHVVILGRRENVQCYGSHMQTVETSDELVALLRKVAKAA
jgi:nucleoside 2-deoxyribosyltransferase